MVVDGRDSLAGQYISESSLHAEDRARDFYFSCKRMFDVLVSAFALLCLSPLLFVIALLIKLDTRGPVFFIQERVGAKRRVHNGTVQWEVCTFPCIKFRSMTHGADQSVHQALAEAFVEGRVTPVDAGSSVKLSQDPRVTRIGKILRKTSLDELPQLVNVLRGDMSLVGPRPVPTYEAAKYQPSHWRRLSATPGVTGLWQVQGRGQVSFETMLAMDVDYIRKQSFWFDVKILFLTVGVLISGRGAE